MPHCTTFGNGVFKFKHEHKTYPGASVRARRHPTLPGPNTHTHNTHRRKWDGVSRDGGGGGGRVEQMSEHCGIRVISVWIPVSWRVRGRTSSPRKVTVHKLLYGSPMRTPFFPPLVMPSF